MRKEPGESSIRWMGITPHAPWTQNCSKKAAALMDFEETNVYRYLGDVSKDRFRVAENLQ